MTENVLFALAFRDDSSGIGEAIRAGADPNAVHPRGGHTPLQVAAQEGAQRALTALLCGGADPNLEFTWTSRVDGRLLPNRVALMFASSGAIVEQLLAAGAKVDATDRSGWTPLACAIAAINLGAFQALLAAGARADVSITLNGKATGLVALVDERAARISALAGSRPNPAAVEMLETLREMRRALIARCAPARGC